MRLVVVSPFLDRQHGTESCVIEQIERLAKVPGWEIQLYSQKVEGVQGLREVGPADEGGRGAVSWHRVPSVAGPHIFKYLWWFFSNQRQRRKEARSGKIAPEIVYSPGINCLDADVIVVHIVFHEFYGRMRGELNFGRTSLLNLPRTVHRRMYYRLIMMLERRIYRDPRVRLIAVSHSLARHLESHFKRTDVKVIPNAVDTERFSEAVRATRRAESRENLQFGNDEFVVLLIGNDWKNKGLETLVKAAALLPEIPVRLLIVGSDDAALLRPVIEELQMKDRVRFESLSQDVMRFYAAADLYAGPSLEDSFGMPVLEAMSCGLPVIASGNAGVSESIRDGETGFILRDPRDVKELARLIRKIHGDEPLRSMMGEAATRSVKGNFNWDQNAEMTRQFLEETAMRHK